MIGNKINKECILFIDGNFLINISRSLSIKLDMERLFEELCGNLHRKRTYWFSALDQSSLDRSNNAFRFLDRLRYIPRTKVYAGRLTRKTSTHHYETTLRTDAGISLAVTMVEKAIMKEAEYIVLVAGDPEFVPAVRTAQRYGAIVKVLVPQYVTDIRIHTELQKIADEQIIIDPDYLKQFEYSPQIDFDVEEDFVEDIKEDEIIKEDIVDELNDNTDSIPSLEEQANIALEEVFDDGDY